MSLADYVCPAPHEIRGTDGAPIYKCRPCGATEKLHWYRGTSCPTCGAEKCLSFLDAEWAAESQRVDDEYGW